MGIEEELQRYAVLIENYRAQLESLENQFSLIQAAIAEYSKARQTVEKLGETENETEVLIPLGGGVFAYGKTITTSKVLTDIGEGILVEKTLSDAVKTLDKRIENLQQSQDTISRMTQRIQEELAEVTSKAQKLLEEQRKTTDKES